jgi:hypothetical protein
VVVQFAVTDVPLFGNTWTNPVPLNPPIEAEVCHEYCRLPLLGSLIVRAMLLLNASASMRTVPVASVA